MACRTNMTGNIFWSKLNGIIIPCSLNYIIFQFWGMVGVRFEALSVFLKAFSVLIWLLYFIFCLEPTFCKYFFLISLLMACSLPFCAYTYAYIYIYLYTHIHLFELCEILFELICLCYLDTLHKCWFLPISFLRLHLLCKIYTKIWIQCMFMTCIHK